MLKCNTGFDDRMFLTYEEWCTYLRRAPVRYLKKKKSNVCEICGKIPTKNNPLQMSHKIGFKIGVLHLGLTPDYVDQEDNIVAAHRKKCNNEAELSLKECCSVLKGLGVVEMPSYLPEETHKIFKVS